MTILIIPTKNNDENNGQGKPIWPRTWECRDKYSTEPRCHRILS